MATSYTSLLGLALPVTGELQGTWGDVVNASITSLVDSAVAGTTDISTDSDVTLTTTTGAANQARQAILLFSGSRATTRTVTLPAQSKAYIVINATTGGYAVNVVGAGPTTGVSVLNGETAIIAWNGSDFVKIGASGSGTFANLTVNGNTILGDASGDTVTVNAGTTTYTQGTANGVMYLNGSKVVTTDSGVTYNGTSMAFADNKSATFGTSADLSIYHDGSDSYIVDSGTGNLNIRGTDLVLGSYGGETYVNAASNGAVTLYYDNASKLATTTGGIDVTGATVTDTLQLDGATANGVAYVNGSKVVTTGTALVFDGTNLGVGAAPSGSYVMEVTGAFKASADSLFSSTGALTISKGTTAERPGSAASGMLRFNTTTTQFEGYNGSSWAPVGGGNSTTYGMWENSATISANYTITSGNNAVSAGPITVDSGVSVTVPSGSVWTIV